MQQNKITVYYDGACPKWVRDRQSYEKLAGQDGREVCWFDISGQEGQLRELGIDPRKALSELHVRDEGGRINILNSKSNRVIRTNVSAFRVSLKI